MGDWPTPLQLVDHILSATDRAAGPRDLLRVVKGAVRDLTPGASDGQVFEHAASVAARVHHLLSVELDQRQARGIAARVELVGPDRHVLRGTSFPHRSLTPKEIERRRRVALVPEILQALCRLRPEEFERLCRALVESLGKAEMLNTRPSHDGGVDFCGRLRLVQEHDAELARAFGEGIAVFVIGQAKRYAADRPVDLASIRELVGAAHIARQQQAIEGRPIWGGLSLRLCEPILPILLTTGPLTAGARELARAIGVWAREGAQIASFLAERGVGLQRHGDRVTFSHEALAAWLREPVPGGDAA